MNMPRFLCSTAVVLSFLNFFPLPLSADVLKDMTFGTLSLRLEETKQDGNSVLSLSVTDPTATSENHFTLSDPNRIVIDLLNSKLHLQKELSVEEKFIQNIRIGSHQDKLRIVLDISSPELPSVLEQNRDGQDGGKFTFVMQSHAVKTAVAPAAKVDPIVPASVEPITPPKKPQQASILSVSRKKAQKDPSEEIVLVPQTITEKEKEITESENEIPREPGLQRIAFLPGATPTLELLLSEKIRFTLLKKSQKKHILKLHQCHANAPHLFLPYFPPHTFPGINLVQAQTNKDDIEITILTDRGTKLLPVVQGTRVLLKVESAA